MLCRTNCIADHVRGHHAPRRAEARHANRDGYLRKETSMSFRTLLDRLRPGAMSNRRGRTRLQPRTCRLDVESLEDRAVPAAMLTIGDVAIVEGNNGTQCALVTVNVTEPHGNSITVNYNTADGTANAGSDYDTVSGKLTFRLNEMSKSLLVPIRGDRLVERGEYLSVLLSNSKGAKIADSAGLVSIDDDEPRVSIQNGSMLEENSGTAPLTFIVSLSSTYDLPVTVNYATAD